MPPGRVLFAAIVIPSIAFVACNTGSVSETDHGPGGAAGDGSVSSSGGSTASLPLSWEDASARRLAVDENPDPEVFETTIVAEPAALQIHGANPSEVYTYNGGIPGPEIRLPVGTRLVVHLKNELPEPTTIHWHGIRVPLEMDGVPDNPYPAVAPGESFTYDFVVPDAGTFWYHPHANSKEQVGFGLYGLVVVTDPAEPPDLGLETSLVLSDMTVDEEGHVDSGGTYATVAIFGEEGEALLVNGREDPVLRARAGERVRFRVLNASRTRYYTLDIPGQEFVRIGGDGGLIEHPVTGKRLVLAPAERADVLVTLQGQPGDILHASWIPTDRGFGSTYAIKPEEIFTIQLMSGARVEPGELPEIARDIPPIDVTGAREVDMALTLTQNGADSFMGINGIPANEAEPIMAMLGDTHVWTLRNTFDFAHPFHLHGYFFQVLDVNGQAPSVREWKDTVDVPVDATVRIAVTFDERPGMWMFHCHILDHAELGMMGMVHVH